MKGALSVDVKKVKYPVVSQALEKAGAQQSKDSPDSKFVWFDGKISVDQLNTILPHQRINRVPGMDVICYKCTFFQALNKAKSQFPRVFTFYPITFILPSQFSDFQNEHRKLATASKDPITWIVKPRAGCCGNGIKLCQCIYEVAELHYPSIVQRYVDPFLVDGFKFDFRFYIFIPTLSPFTAFIYNEGIARFCTEQYSAPCRQNLADTFCHLTNTAVNVKNQKAQGKFTFLASEILTKIKKSQPDGNLVWGKVKQAAALSMTAIYPQIITSINNYEVERRKVLWVVHKLGATGKGPSSPNALPPIKKYCHLIGIDVLLDSKLDPVILEINDRPSLSVTFDLEAVLKPQLIYDVLNLITIDGSAPSEISHRWQQILPIEGQSDAAAASASIIQQSTQNAPQSLMSVTRHSDPFFGALKTEALPPLLPNLYGH